MRANLEELLGCRLVSLPPKLPQILLEVVRHGQGSIEFKSFFQASLLVTLIAKVFSGFQEQPPNAFEDLPLFTQGLVVDRAS